MKESMIAIARKVDRLFVLFVVVPTLCAILYFGLFASDVYISESKFVVRSPEKPVASGLGIILRSAGFSTNGNEVFAAESFVQSRDALRNLNKNSSFQNAYSASSISIFDRFGPLGFWSSYEDLYKYYRSHVTIKNETSSSISTLTVRAYNAEAARAFNEQLIVMAEATVNRLNERGREDLIRLAMTEVADAKEKATAAALMLARYRDRSGIVDPEKQASVQMQMISKLQDELIATKAQLAQLRTFTPQNPQVPVFKERVEVLEREIGDQMGQVAGNQRSLAATAASYQRLLLESQFADKQLAGAMASLEDARSEARRKLAYVERIVQPNLPDAPLEPRRLRSILSTLIVGLIGWGIATMLIAGIKEHQD
jgi:capsular polysaccharide transport system permease protein